MSQILQIDGIQDLIAKDFNGRINAMCWQRELKGDFLEIVKKIEATGNLLTLKEKQIIELDLSMQGQLARKVILEDIRVLKEHGAEPTLNLIKYYDKDDSFFPTDVYSFHVDHSPVPTSTFLCTYYGASSDILPNKQAIQKVCIPEIRAKLRALYDGAESGFNDFLKAYYFDLHYDAKENAEIINLGNGNMWKLAVDHPKSKVLPCIHRAPKEKKDESRLLLIC